MSEELKDLSPEERAAARERCEAADELSQTLSIGLVWHVPFVLRALAQIERLEAELDAAHAAILDEAQVFGASGFATTATLADIIRATGDVAVSRIIALEEEREELVKALSEVGFVLEDGRFHELAQAVSNGRVDLLNQTHVLCAIRKGSAALGMIERGLKK